MKITHFLKSAVSSPSHLFKKAMNPVRQWVQSSFARVRPNHKTHLAHLENRNLSSNVQLGNLHPDLAKVFGETGKPAKAIVVNQEAAKSKIYAKFAEDFGKKAGKPEEFHALMKTVYGGGYDKAQAESFRQKALQGNFEWLPPIKFLGEGELGQANGAYDKEAGTVYLSEKLLNDPQKAASTYMEEVGHHLDTKLNKNDTVGDEGEMFRRIMSGEKLNQAQIQEIRNDDDHGTIQINGKTVEVEFWNPFKAIGKAVKSVGKGIVNVAKKVGDFGAKVVKGAVKGVSQLVTGVVDAGIKTVKGLADGVIGFGKNLIQGKIGQALGSLWQGVDKGLLQLPARLGSTIIDSTKTVADGLWDAMGKVGTPFKWVSDRVFNFARTGVDTATGILRDLVNIGPEVAINAISGIESFGRQLFQGNFSGAFKTLAMIPVNTMGRIAGGGVDAIARGIYGIGSNASFLIGIEKNVTPKGLDSKMVKDFQAIYGDSLDLSVVQIKQGGFGPWGAPKTIGNTIYLPKSWGSYDVFDTNGKLTDGGRKLIMHEMVHVWQNQNGGGDYIHKSLWNQAMAFIKGGNRNGAYDWEAAVSSGKKFSELNPEQQASAIEILTWTQSKGISLNTGNPIQYLDPETGGVKTLTVAQQDFLRGAFEMVRQGEGAP